MWVCKECFVDEEMRKEVENNSIDEGKCDVCGKTGKRCNLSVFADFFVSVFPLFKKDANSEDTIISILERDWNVFSNSMCAKTILNEIIHTNAIPISIDDKVSYTDDIINRVNVWDQLKKDVKENYRYFVDHDRFDDYVDLSPSSELKEGTLLYRARIIPEGKKKLKSKDMGCPEKGKATAGRANPLGIPYLYLCRDEKTTYYEVRSVYLDRLSIGKFRIQRDLRIVDFNSKSSLFLSFDGANPLSDTVVKKKILEALSHDLSKPMRRYDTELEYIRHSLSVNIANGAKQTAFVSEVHFIAVESIMYYSTQKTQNV